MSISAVEFKERTKQFAIRVINLVNSLPRNRASTVIGNQLLRSATCVGANYRAACRGRSRAEFAAKLGIVEEETDESMYWLELLADPGLMTRQRLTPLIDESNQILAMVTSSIRTVKGRKESNANNAGGPS